MNTCKENYYLFYDIFLKQGDVFMIGPYYPLLHFPTKRPVLVHKNRSINGLFVQDKEKHTALWKFQSDGSEISGEITIKYCHITQKIKLEKEKNNKKNYVSISTTMQNEYIYLEPWIEYHLASGVDHFYLYDNNSDDQKRLLDMLGTYISRGIVTLIHWNYPYSVIGHNHNPLPINSHYYCSIVAINHCIHKYGGETEWLIAMDVDEYLVPKKTDKVVNIARQLHNTDLAAIYISDYVFGKNESSGPCLVKRFLKRAAKKSRWLCSGKVLLRPAMSLFCEVHILTSGGKMIIMDPDIISINHYHYSKNNHRLAADTKNLEVIDTRCLELWNQYFSKHIAK